LPKRRDFSAAQSADPDYHLPYQVSLLYHPSPVARITISLRRTCFLCSAGTRAAASPSVASIPSSSTRYCIDTATPLPLPLIPSSLHSHPLPAFLRCRRRRRHHASSCVDIT
jgi:hypothetical protein